MNLPPSSDSSPQSAPTSNDPVELAMEAEATGRQPGPATPAGQVLERQARLLSWQIANARVGFLLKVLGGVAGLAAVLLLGLAIAQAARSRALIVEPFSLPPDFATHGLTGAVAAQRLMDELGRMDAASESFRAGGSYTDSWSGELRLQIPQTGVSISELDRYLRSWLGHETHISGDVIETAADHLALTVRTGREPGVAVEGRTEELDTLIRHAAEQVFNATQPYQYSKWLEYHDRSKEAMAVAQRLAQDGPPDEQVWAWSQIGNLLLVEGDAAGSSTACDRALAIEPEQVLALFNKAMAERALGHDEIALSFYQRTLDRISRPHPDVSVRAVQTSPLQIRVEIARLTGDYRRAAEIGHTRLGLPNFQNNNEAKRLMLEEDLERLHDPEAARAAAPTGVTQAEIDAYGVGSVYAIGSLISAEYVAAVEAGDDAAAIAVIERLLAVPAVQGAHGTLARQRWLLPMSAIARARSGDALGAEAALQDSPLDCVLCLRARGVAASAVKDRAAADRWFGMAVKLAPSIPFAYVDWGRAELAFGDTAAAIALFKQAEAKGPHWADPFKLEADARVKQGDIRAALPLYTAAAEQAPQWGALFLAWGRALDALDHRAEAKDKYRAASSMDLSAAERADLNRLLGSRT